MVRSMYSGVSGLRSHQTRMDTIGNNIANVNTYGFKSSRTTFRDIYYQTMSSASGPSAAAGGMNPSQVGYGAQVGSVDLMMSRSTFTMTDQTMDLAIDGDGFFQVQDSAGNTYYTRAGILNFDAAGNLVDMQGNYVLGVNGDPSGRAPASEKIRVSLPAVSPKASEVTQSINGREYTIKSSNASGDGNINFNFTTDASLADGAVEASISATGIIVKFNPDNQYSSWAEVNSAINAAIYKANGNKEHPAGSFSIAVESGGDPFAGGVTLSADELTSTDYAIKLGEASFGGRSFFGGITTSGKVGNGFTGTGAMDDLTCTFMAGPPEKWKLTMKVGSDTYEGYIDDTKTSAGKFNLTKVGGDDSDYIEMNRPSFAALVDRYALDHSGAAPTNTDAFNPVTATEMGSPIAKASAASRALGFSGTAFALRGGTSGGMQTIADMTGISIAPNGMILGYDSQGLEIMIGRIDLATFANAAGLAQSGSSNFVATANSGAAKLGQPGTGGAGQLVGGSLELSNVDLSREFSDMITTQRGYQANSRIITVSDTMLEELINLKR